ncbi:MAG: PAS domain-containing protein, partial [Haliea sp.]|nr:PAS domain-containing protein [Haliea sp.]
DIVWDTPASGEFETEQLGWSAFTGQSFEELRGLGWMNAIHPDDQMETTRLWALALANRAVYEVEHRVLACDHTWRNMLARAVPPSLLGGWGALAVDWRSHGHHRAQKAEARINYLNRVYAVLSGINLLIVRARERKN